MTTRVIYTHTGCARSATSTCTCTPAARSGGAGWCRIWRSTCRSRCPATACPSRRTARNWSAVSAQPGPPGRGARDPHLSVAGRCAPLGTGWLRPLAALLRSDRRVQERAGGPRTAVLRRGAGCPTPSGLLDLNREHLGGSGVRAEGLSANRRRLRAGRDRRGRAKVSPESRPSVQGRRQPRRAGPDAAGRHDPAGQAATVPADFDRRGRPCAGQSLRAACSFWKSAPGTSTPAGSPSAKMTRGPAGTRADGGIRAVARAADRLNPSRAPAASRRRAEAVARDQHARTPEIVANLEMGFMCYLQFLLTTGAIDKAQCQHPLVAMPAVPPRGGPAAGGPATGDGTRPAVPRTAQVGSRQRPRPPEHATANARPGRRPRAGGDRR